MSLMVGIFPTLINVTFSSNEANQQGGRIYHDGNGESLTLINTILWDNNGNIYLRNDNANTEIVNLYYSVIEGGTTLSTTASGIRLRNTDTIVYPIEINNKEAIDDDPGFGPLVNHGGEITPSPLATIARPRIRESV